MVNIPHRGKWLNDFGGGDKEWAETNIPEILLNK
jgi:hypothetical protein